MAVDGMSVEGLPVVRACDLDRESPEARWLVRDIWVRQAVGIIGGQPKLGKSWMGLDMAISVASATPCLGQFEVHEPGSALIYLAEDSLGAVRARLDALCTHRCLDLAGIDLNVITAPVVRLDLEEHRAAIHLTLHKHKPRLLVLDPLVRMHRLDENSSAEISGLLGFLRELQRTHGVAIALVHHASKKHRARPGQALRGSSDLHAFIDSLAYLVRKKDDLELVLEHRSAPSPDPVPLKLVSRPDGLDTHLEVVGKQAATNDRQPLAERVIDLLRVAPGPLLRKQLRESLRVNNQRLGDALEDLLRQGRLARDERGWTLQSGHAQLALV